MMDFQGKQSPLPGPAFREQPASHLWTEGNLALQQSLTDLFDDFTVRIYEEIRLMPQGGPEKP